MQFLTSASKFLGVSWPPDPTFPSPCVAVQSYQHSNDAI